MKKSPNNPLSVFIREHAGLLVQLKKLNTAAKSIEIKGLSRKSLNTVNVVLLILELMFNSFTQLHVALNHVKKGKVTSVIIPVAQKISDER